MNLRTGQRDDVDINITPLIDVVFLLLIFFMVSTTFTRQSEIELTLPQAAEDIHDQAVDFIEVAIDRNGRYFINGQQTADARVDTIRRALAAALENNDETTLIINADQAASYQSVINVMDAARQINLYRITFSTRVRDDAATTSQ